LTSIDVFLDEFSIHEEPTPLDDATRAEPSRGAPD
jgi:hypothetical protein